MGESSAGTAVVEAPAGPQARPRATAGSLGVRSEGARTSVTVLGPGHGWTGAPAPILGGGALKSSTDALEFNALPDSVLLSWLTSRGHRPNVLIECAKGSTETAMRHLMTWSALPFRYCALPGKLELPSTRRGTLLLKDAAELTLSQQVALYDWLSLGTGDMQVVSLASRPLAALVEDGEFLEGLYFRLNVIRLNARHGTRPAPLDTWQDAAGRMA